MTEIGFILNIDDNILLEHLLANHENLSLVRRHSFGEPVENFFASAAHRVLAEPAIFVVLHLDIFVHDKGPLFKVLKLIIFNFSLATIDFVSVDFAISIWAKTFGIRVTALLSRDQVNDLKNLMLNIILINKGQNLMLDCWEVCDLEN